MEVTKILLAKRLKQLRKSRGLTQEQLAELIGRDTKHISKLEIAGCYPSLTTLDRIASVLNVELKDIFNFDSVQNKKFNVDEFINIIKTSDEEKLKKIYKLYQYVSDL